MARSFALQGADLIVLFATLKVTTICMTVIFGALFSPDAFVAGAACVASIMFTDYYLFETDAS